MGKSALGDATHNESEAMAGPTRHPPEASGLGDRIKAARKNAGLSQKELARRLAVSQPTVANWESGAHDPRRTMLERLSDALKLPSAWLAGTAAEARRSAFVDYMRRPVRHVPVVDWGMAAGLPGHDDEGDTLGQLAEQALGFIPLATRDETLFALSLEDDRFGPDFPAGAAAIVDFTADSLKDGEYCLGQSRGRALICLWSNAQGAPVCVSSGEEAATLIGRITHVLRAF